jgi:hypothetical protein
VEWQLHNQSDNVAVLNTCKVQIGESGRVVSGPISRQLILVDVLETPDPL